MIEIPDLSTVSVLRLQGDEHPTLFASFRPNFGFSLSAIAFPLVPNIERLTVVTSPPDIDPRVLAWKGITMITRLDILNDMWVTEVEWVSRPVYTTEKASATDKDPTRKHSGCDVLGKGV